MLRAIALVLLLLVPLGQAQINGPQTFEADFRYMQGINAQTLRIVSGAVAVDLDSVTGPFGFFDTDGVTVADLDRVCWTQPGQAGQCLTGDLSIRALDGASIGIDLPGAVSGTYDADHGLGLFVDFEDDKDLNSFKLKKSLVLPAVSGKMAFGDISTIPFAATFNLRLMGGLVALDSISQLQILQNGAVAQQFTGKDVSISFEGKPIIAPFGTDLVVLPFEADSTAQFAPARSAAAATGLKLSRIDELTADVDAAGEGKTGGGEGPGIAKSAGEFETLLSEVLNGALLRVPIGNNVADELQENFAFIRFDDLQVEAVGDRLAWSGTGALVMKDGAVQGAPELYGFSFFKLPWWSYLMWGLAIAAFITRVALKTPKKHLTWDRYRWIGWAFAAIAFIVVFLLWDFEVRSVWGTSLFTTDARGGALGVTAAVQILPLLFVFFAVAAPLHMLFRNGLMLGRQGTFMGLGSGLSYLLAYVFGATLFLSYLELVLVQVLEKAGG